MAALVSSSLEDSSSPLDDDGDCGLALPLDGGGFLAAGLAAATGGFFAAAAGGFFEAA